LEVGIKKADEGAYTDAFWTVEYTVIHFTHGSPLIPLVTSVQLSRRSGEMMFGGLEDKSTKTMWRWND
jgi:hypothetical protein